MRLGGPRSKIPDAGCRASLERPLHVGFYSPALPSSGASNGIVTYTGIMRDALRALGHSVSIVTTHEIEHADGSISPITSPNRALRRFRYLLERIRPDDGSDVWARMRVIDAFRAAQLAGVQVFEIEESFGWAARLEGYGLPIVERLHGPHVFGREPVETAEQRTRGNVREKAELASFQTARTISCPSRRLLDALIERYQLRVPITEVTPNPIPIATKTWDYSRANANQILCVGRFDLRKGGDLVLHAFARAFQSNRRLKLLMAGPDSGLIQSDGRIVHFDDFVRSEVAPEVRAQIIHLGAINRERIAELRLQSALQIVGSRFENFPNSIAEAMAAGMPVLASDSYGNGELIRDGVEGRLFPVGDVNAIAKATVEMIGHPSMLAEMGRSAYERAATFLCPSRVARQTIALYHAALAQS